MKDSVINENIDLKLYVISCHKDKELQDDVSASKYESGIQAGAVLTDIRTQGINDHDGFADSISDRNERYSEGTAMYWIYRNDTSEYIGISHYRRRFDLTDKELENIIGGKADIVTLDSVDLGQSIKDNYIEMLYGKDWELFMDIILRHSPEYYEYALQYFDNNFFHPCNMNIFRGELYQEFGDWAFPIVDEFYRLSPRKTDRYQRRDAGFILERLSSLYVEIKKNEGCNVVEVPLRVLKSIDFQNVSEKTAYDTDAIWERCCSLYKEDNITEIKNIVKNVVHDSACKSLKLLQLAVLIMAAESERHNEAETMFEYLPYKWRENLDTLLSSFVALGNMLELVCDNSNAEAIKLLIVFLNSTQYSLTVIHVLCIQKNIDENKIEDLIDYISVGEK